MVHIYAFGSLCRGEIDSKSDIDLLAVVDRFDSRFDPSTYSIYSYKRLDELWKEGNPFAWHLAIESKLIYSSDGKDFIKDLGKPSEYVRAKMDCIKFYNLYCTALSSIKNGSKSLIFELSTVFLAIRNFATCFLLGRENIANFSRQSALQMGERSLHISDKVYSLLEHSRILSIRGTGHIVGYDEIVLALKEVALIKDWMETLLLELGVKSNGRIQ